MTLETQNISSKQEDISDVPNVLCTDTRLKPPPQSSPLPTNFSHEVGSSSQKLEPNSFDFTQSRMDLLLPLLPVQMFKVLYFASAHFFARRVARLISFTILLIHIRIHIHMNTIHTTLPA